MCLGEEVPPESDCSRYNHCSGKGVCHSGFCECLNGYSGMDCSFKQVLSLEDLFKNYFLDLLLCSISGSIICLWIYFFVKKARANNRQAGQQPVETEENLLDYIELIDSDSESSSPQCDQSSDEDEESGQILKCESSTTSMKHRSDECVICMSKEKLVVLVPCGHTSICRKCSKRVEFCPFCRAQIYRRQKIFMPA